MMRSVEELVDRQIRRWELARRATASVPPPPCIAISRYPRAGAAELAQHAAERLGYACFGIEIVDLIARRTGYRQELVAGVDEHVRTAIERSVTDAFRHERFAESDYLRQVVRTIAALGERGGAVILGRGSPFILPPERALRVLVVAPARVRVDRLMKERSVSPEAAVSLLAGEDAERHAFLHYHFKLNPDDPALYDLTLNLGSLSREAATDLLLDAFRARFPESNRRSRQVAPSG